jgi:hypothetical protein
MDLRSLYVQVLHVEHVYWLICTYRDINTYGEEKSGEENPNSCPVAGFGERREISAGFRSGLATLLQGHQEAGDATTGRRCSRLVQKAGAGLPDQNQSGAPEGNDGGEKGLVALAINPLCGLIEYFQNKCYVYTRIDFFLSE